MPFEIKLAYDDLSSVKELFAEYTSLLAGLESKIQYYWRLQNFDGELEDLEGKYGLPDGRLYIAYADHQAAGCIALRRLNETESEMKRLYIKPPFRGAGLGKVLIERVISDAKEIGYRAMLLDTLPVLQAAMKLYENAGFYRIPPYNDSPVEKTVFMKLDLL